MKKFILSMTLLVSSFSFAFSQQPQTQTAPISAINAKYVQGIGIGFWPTIQSGLNLKVSAGTVNCTGSIQQYSDMIVTLTASTTNYIFLNTSSSCIPSSKTTTFNSSDIPIAVITTGSSTITNISDVRSMFQAPGVSLSPSAAQTIAGQILNLNLSGISLPTLPSSTAISIWGPSGSPTRALVASYGGTSYFTSLTYGGTASVPTAVTSAEELGGFNSWAYDGTSIGGPAAAFRIYANQTWAPGAHGTYADIAITPNGTTTETEVAKFTSAGITTPGVTDSGLTQGNCVQAGSAGLLSNSGGPCPETSSNIYVANNQIQTDSTAMTLTNGAYFLGDSIPGGGGATSAAFGFVTLMASDYNLPLEGSGTFAFPVLYNYAHSGNTAADCNGIFLSNLAPPTDTGNPLGMMLCGENNANGNSAVGPTGLPSFLQYQYATAYYAATSSSNKVLATDPTLAVTGSPTTDTSNPEITGLEFTAAGTVTYNAQIGPCGCFAILIISTKNVPGSFTMTDITTSTVLTDTITGISPTTMSGLYFFSHTVGLAAAHYAGLTQGAHQLQFSWSSGTVDFAEFMFPPVTRYRGASHPRFLMPGVLATASNWPLNNDTWTALYNAANLSVSQQAVQDGLDVPFVDVNKALDRSLDFFGADYTGSITGNVLTISAVAAGGVQIGDGISLPLGTTVSYGYITAQTSGTTGGVGTYTLSASNTVSSQELQTIRQKCPAAQPTTFGEHPDDCGHVHLKQAYESVIGSATPVPTYGANGTFVMPTNYAAVPESATLPGTANGDSTAFPASTGSVFPPGSFCFARGFGTSCAGMTGLLIGTRNTAIVMADQAFAISNAPGGSSPSTVASDIVFSEDTGAAKASSWGGISTTPTAALGTSGSAGTISFGSGSTNVSGTISFTTSSTPPAASTTLLTVTFGTPAFAGFVGGCTWFGDNAASALILSDLFYTKTGTPQTTYSMSVGATTLPSNTSFAFNYWCG